MSKRDFTRAALTREGYEGWVVFPSVLVPVVRATLPKPSGTYIVLRPSGTPPEFLAVSPAGWHKRKNPTATPDALAANWVEGAQVVYIGKAKSIEDRVCSMARQGAGRNAGHHGGRLVWQLCDSAKLLIAWRRLRPGFTTHGDDEDNMILRFRQAYGKPPFANNPEMLGR